MSKIRLDINAPSLENIADFFNAVRDRGQNSACVLNFLDYVVSLRGSYIWDCFHSGRYRSGLRKKRLFEGEPKIRANAKLVLPSKEDRVLSSIGHLSSFGEVERTIILDYHGVEKELVVHHDKIEDSLNIIPHYKIIPKESKLVFV